MLSKKYIILIILIVFSLTITCVNAEDLNSTDSLTLQEDFNHTKIVFCNNNESILVLNENSSEIASNSSPMLNNKTEVDNVYGIIDFGSNVISLNIFDVTDDKITTKLTMSETSVVSSYTKDNNLTEEGIEKLISILENYEHVMRSYNVDTEYTFATASLRKINNREEVVTTVKDRLGIYIDVISEEREVSLGFDAVKEKDLTTDSGLFIDLGGGSCEVVNFTKKTPVTAKSMPIGSNSCYKEYVSELFPNETERMRIQNRTLIELKKLKTNNTTPVDDLYGTGGTIYTMKLMLIYLKFINETETVIPTSMIGELLDNIKASNKVNYQKIINVAANRIHNLIPGIIITKTILEYFNVKNLHFCTGQIEDAVLFELMKNESAKEKIQLNISDINATCDEDIEFLINLQDDAKGNLDIELNNATYRSLAHDGTVLINTPKLEPGNYTALIKYYDDVKYQSGKMTVNIFVKSNDDYLAEFDITDERVDVTLPDDATGYLLIDIDDVGYYTPVKDGKAQFDIPELSSGNHTVIATYTGNNKYASKNANKTININETIISTDLVKIENAPDRFTAKFLDNEGNALSKINVEFKINGISYNKTTDADGYASIGINLIANNYTITITNPVTGEVKNNLITVLPRFVENHDLVKFYRNSSQYIVKVLDDKGNPAKAGEIVTFNINGIVYKRTVNETGHVQLNINLNPGNYTITAEYKGSRVSNTITVLPVLTADDLTKKYGETTQFVATLVDGESKPYENQNITFNINGMIYNRTTDSLGQAKLNINLMPGQYIITSMFENGAIISNKITIES